MLAKKQAQCQLVPVLLFKFLSGHKIWCIDMYLYTHKNTQNFGNNWLLNKWKTILFKCLSTKDGWNFKQTQHKYFLTKKWCAMIINERNVFPVNRTFFTLRKTHMLTLFTPSLIYLYAGLFLLLLKCMFKWHLNPQYSLQSWICDIFYFSGKIIMYQDPTANSLQQ